ncbi:MAG: BA14K family protein [Pseudomonadota bacterium]
MKYANLPIFKTIAITTATALTMSLMPVSTASAHDARYYGKHKHHHHNRAAHKPRVKVIKKNKKSELIAAGVIGLALGAIIASEAGKNRRAYAPAPSYAQPNYNSSGYKNYNSYYQPQPSYSEYQPEYQQPQVITYEDTISIEPWTSGWHRWCSRNYRSFNPETGTYRGYDGLNHFCVVK